MARDGLDVSELDAFTDRLIRSSKEANKEQKKFLRQEGNALKRKTKQQMRIVNLGEKTGNYKKGIKRGKVYEKDDSNRVRVYSNAPHAHLIEDGHDQMVNPGKGPGGGRGVKKGRGKGRKVGRVEGRQVFAAAADQYAPTFAQHCEDAIDRMIDKI